MTRPKKAFFGKYLHYKNVKRAKTHTKIINSKENKKRWKNSLFKTFKRRFERQSRGKMKTSRITLHPSFIGSENIGG